MDGQQDKKRFPSSGYNPHRGTEAYQYRTDYVRSEQLDEIQHMKLQQNRDYDASKSTIHREIQLISCILRCIVLFCLSKVGATFGFKIPPVRIGWLSTWWTDVLQRVGS